MHTTEPAVPVVDARWSDTTFTAMGSTTRILVRGGPPELPDVARRRVDELEARWSRFQPTSELCRLNAAADVPVVVSEETFDVIALAVTAWRETGGRFDPTIIDALEQLGYDRDFSLVRTSAGPAAAVRAAPGCGEIIIDPLPRAVWLPAGVRLDLGGIGKGHAADVVAAELLAAGADGVCVNLGGDVRVAGCSPEPGGWRVDLDPMLTSPLALPRSFRLGDGAVATSTRLRRAWTRDGEPHHHLVDPSNGRSAWSGLATVTVLGRSAAWAEVLAKAALVSGPVAGAAVIEQHNATGQLVHDDGRVEELPGLAAFLG